MGMHFNSVNFYFPLPTGDLEIIGPFLAVDVDPLREQWLAMAYGYA